jgi:lipooligosaccharide transport system permease protein
MNRWLPPMPSRRMWRLVARNARVWRKLMGSSIATHLADPVIYFLGFGLGVGSLIGDVNGESYLQFIAAGMAGYTVLNSASFEGLYSAFTRMHVQRTWESILNTPMTLDDVIFGEWLWAALKGLFAGTAVLLVISIFQLAVYPTALLVIPCMVVACLAFSGMALAFNSIAPGYEFFSFYFSLFIAPMMILSGAFFPVEAMPAPLQVVSAVLPLRYMVDLARPLLVGEFPESFLLPIFVLLAYALVGLWVATVLTRRRLLS